MRIERLFFDGYDVGSSGLDSVKLRKDKRKKKKKPNDLVMDWFMKTFEKVDDDTRIISFRKDIYPRFIRDEVPSRMSQSELRKYLARHVTLKHLYKEFERRMAVLSEDSVPLKSKIRHVFTNFRCVN